MGRQDWRTPPSVFRCLADRWGPFDLDAAADPSNALCPRHLTVRAGPPIGHDWLDRVWVNPPFGDIMPWVRKAASHNGRTVMLTPANTSSPWFLRAIKHAALYLPTRRIAFWHPAEKPGSPDRDTVVWVFGEEPSKVHSIEIPDHTAEVKRLHQESKGQASLFRPDWLL